MAFQIRNTKETPEEREARVVKNEEKRKEEYAMVEELLSFDAYTRNNVKLREEDFFLVKDLISKSDITQLPRAKSRYRSEYQLDGENVASNFHKKYPFFRKMNMKNLFIAGGSVSRFALVTTQWHPITDIDIFVCGIQTPEAAEDRIREWVKQLKTHVSIVSITRSEFAITIRTDVCPIQIILRLYSTPSEVLHGFDLGSCMIGIWERDAYTTRLGQFSFENRCNILNLPRRSTTYERRLFKYEYRGFDIVLPDFDTSISMDYRSDGFKKSGFYIWNDGDKLDIRAAYRRADRLVANRRICDYAVEGPKTAHKVNLERISKWKPEEPFPQLIRVSYVIDMDPDDMAEELFNTSVKGMSDHLIDHLFERANVADISHINIRKRDIFLPGVSLDMIYQMIQSKQSLAPLLEISKKIFKEKMTFLMEKGRIPIKWIVVDPGTQLCGSFNPTVVTKEEWYGKYLLKQ